ncbi:MAG TPA: flap endonuclease [Gammaproteobacteria bacterium]|nr:flap endonuclease [Gammaproteobacteria bacterium]
MACMETPSIKQTAWLVDSSIYVFKSWFVLPDTLVDVDGRPINAVLGFLNFAADLLSREQPEHIGFAFDESLKSSFRNEIYPPYKANRDPAPVELKYQFQLCRQFLRAAGIAEFGSDRYEADDLIGSWAKYLQSQGYRIHVITGDKDLTQLIKSSDLWWEYGKNIKLDSAGVKKKHGVRPDQIADLLAIAGDKVDNIPGVPGVGAATAVKLLNKFDNIENLLSRIPEIGSSKLRGAKRIERLIEENREEILTARKITGVYCDAQIDQQRGLTLAGGDEAALEAIFDQLKLPGYVRQRWIKLIM